MGRKGHKPSVVIENPENLPSIVFELSDEPVPYHEQPYKAKLWAKYAWLNSSYSIAYIAESIEVGTGLVSKWINGTQKEKGWKEELELAEKRTVTNLVARNTKRIEYTLGKALDLLAMNTERLINERHQFSVAEYSMFTGAVERLFKLKQLEEGKPTEIVSADGKTLSWEAIRKQIEDVDILDYKKVAKID
jgi:hypothetical protein